MPLTARHLSVLRRLAEAEDAGRYDEAEIVCEGRSCWIDCDRVPSRILDDLLRFTLLRDVSDGGGLRRYAVNGSGRSAIRRPELADELWRAVLSGVPVTVEDDRVVPLDGPKR